MFKRETEIEQKYFFPANWEFSSSLVNQFKLLGIQLALVDEL